MVKRSASRLLLTKCPLSQENRILLAQPNYDVRSRVSVDSFRTFVGAIGGTKLDIKDDNASDLELLSDEFKFTSLSTAVAAWRAANPAPDANTRLITASLDERLQSHDRALCVFDRKVDQVHRAAIEGERAKVVEVVESIQRGSAAFLPTAAKDIELAAEQRRALGRDLCALEGKIGGLWEAIAASGAKLKEDLGSVGWQVKDCQRQSQEREAGAMAEVRNMVGRLEARLQAVIEENGHQMLVPAEMRGANEQLRVETTGLKQRIEMLEQENRRLLLVNEVMKRDIGEVSGLKGLPANLEEKHEKLQERLRGRATS
jgi:hypothetical protein